MEGLLPRQADGDRLPDVELDATDGVDEVLRVMYGGVPSWGTFTPDPSATVRVTATDSDDTWFLTGTDEHGVKMVKTAAAEGVEPAELADRNVAVFRAVWKELDITFDDFIRTTEPRHKVGVRRIVERLLVLPDETVEQVLADYAAVAAGTDALVRSLPDLDSDQALPDAPWFPPGEAWSNRRVFAHVLAEISQHAGHADIVREAIDGQKSMG